MKESLVGYYVRLADRQDYGYQTYGGDAAVASLRIFRAYHPDARFQMIDAGGRPRWMTPTMMRIHAVLARESLRPNGDLVKIRRMAAEARTSPGYFSKVLERFTAWGMFASISIRGRTGGIYLWARKAGDTFERYAREARLNIEGRKVLAEARRLRREVALNVSTMLTVIRGEYGGNISPSRETVIRSQGDPGAGMAGDHGPGWGDGGSLTAY